MGIVGHGFVGKTIDYAFTHERDKFLVDPLYDTDIDDLIDYKPIMTSLPYTNACNGQ